MFYIKINENQLDLIKNILDEGEIKKWQKDELYVFIINCLENYVNIDNIQINLDQIEPVEPINPCDQQFQSFKTFIESLPETS